VSDDSDARRPLARRAPSSEPTRKVWINSCAIQTPRLKSFTVDVELRSRARLLISVIQLRRQVSGVLPTRSTPRYYAPSLWRAALDYSPCSSASKRATDAIASRKEEAFSASRSTIARSVTRLSLRESVATVTHSDRPDLGMQACYNDRCQCARTSSALRRVHQRLRLRITTEQTHG
jgi:hypothetical protein